MIVVTGATGFTGPFVVRALRAAFPKARLRVAARATSRTDEVAGTCDDIAIADLRDTLRLTEAFRGADVLVNVASLGFDWVENILVAANTAGIERGVFISTTAMLTRLPVASKPTRERAEDMVRARMRDWTILRPTMIYGTPADRNIARLIRFVRRMPVIPIIAGGAWQQPVHVEDVANAVAGSVGCAASVRAAFNISGREPLTFRGMVEVIVRALGRRRLVFECPHQYVYRAVQAWDRFARPPVRPEQILRLAEDKHFDHAAAAAAFGYSPRSFADGVKSEVALLGYV